ncbi:protein root UVB sensitive 4 isoform X2 [Nymphaea colorata]|uniref:protein root UVB sensitive 4 isoform X2 n=1 Tax=Nymphaea colorata TaxID=210225 RepID=UPI00129EF9D7|nr:protein root UVB sensitive 4 isoform X2 [Nymphaea colorata]
MHAAVHLCSKCPQPHNRPWKSTEHLLQRKPQGPCFLYPSPKPLRPWQKREALKIPSGYPLGRREEKQEEEGEKEAEPTCPSIRIHRGDSSSRFVLDGSHLRQAAVDHHGLSFNGSDELVSIFSCWAEISLSALKKLFIPLKVGPSYMDYMRWKFVHRICSSSLQVLATQAMFRAIGIGSSRSLPSAAAFNWVLKDGLGRLSRCIYTARVGTAFDTNLKRVRFSTSVLFSLGVGVEMLTSIFPQYFLLLAAIANIAKSISLAAYIATSSAIHRSFAIADNLGEISAKAQIQTVCFDNLGLMLAAVLNLLCKNYQRLQTVLPLMIYPFLAAMDLYAISQGLKHVHLQTLTKNRLDIIVKQWIQSGLIPSPAEVSSEEDNTMWRKDNKQWQIRIGCIDTKDPCVEFLQQTMQSLQTNDMYFICLEASKDCLLLCLHRKACTTDILRGMLEACHIRETLSLHRTKAMLGATSVQSKDEPLEIAYPGNTQDSDFESFDTCAKDWFKMVGESRKFAERSIGLLTEEMKKSGWIVKNVLLNSQEQIRFSLEM